MTGNISPAGQVLGATASGVASTAVLANTGNITFQIIAISVLIISVTLLLVRAVKVSVS